MQMAHFTESLNALPQYLTILLFFLLQIYDL